MLNRQARMDVMESGIAIHSIWYTIQGEGPHIGTPAVFVRLYGCNLQCPLCDTDYTSPERLKTFESSHQAFHHIRAEAAKLTENLKLQSPPLIVFTGGEPFRQYEFPHLCALLMDAAYPIQIETNGSLFPHGQTYAFMDLPACSIVVSPKRQVDDQWFDESLSNRSFRVYYKYLIQRGKVDPIDGLPVGVLGYQIKVRRPPAFARAQGHVMVQPVDVHDNAENELNVQACVTVAMQHGYRYTPQLHKALGLP